MSSLDLATGFFDIARATTGLAANWLIQSTLLISGGLVLGYLLHSRGSAVQSAVYRTTLVAVLACPLATWLLSLAGISGWSLEMPEAYYHAEYAAGDAAAAAERFRSNVPARSATPRIGAEPAFEQLSATADSSFGTRRDFELSAQAENQFAASRPQPPLVENMDAVELEPMLPPVASVFTVERFGIIAAVAGALWLFIAAWLLCRLAIAWWDLYRIRRSAWSAEAATLQLCRELAALFNVKPPDVLHSPYLPSPCLAGLRNPAVLLPDGELSLPWREVLAHELAHLRRHDCWWNLLRRVATAMLFFQPLLWKLSRRLDSTAEEVCDDYVVQFGGDRYQYAHRLVDIAELSLAPAAAAGVGIVSLRSMLATRVARIMDTSRSLSTRAGRMLLAVVLLAGLAATFLVGLVGIQPDHAAADTPNATNPAKSSEESSNGQPAPQRAIGRSDGNGGPSQPSGETVIEYAGEVVTPDGKPVAGAKVFLIYHYRNASELLVPSSKPLALTDDSGRFRVAVKASDLPGHKSEWSVASIAAVADGYGFAWSLAAAYETSGTFMSEYRARLDSIPARFRAQMEKQLAAAGQPLRLVSDSEPIRGQILDINGEPVRGAKLTLLEVWTGADDELTPWLNAAKEEKADYYSARTQTPRLMNGPQVRSLVTPAVTDSGGRFSLSGVGRERIVELLVEGPGIETSKIFARTRAGEKIELPKERQSPHLGNYTYHPSELVHVAGPSKPIVGVVTDRKTGRALAGVTIKSQQRHGHAISGWGQDFVRTLTGSEGRYRLEGMRIGSDNTIAAIPPTDQCYIARSMPADTTTRDAELEVNVELQPGIWLAGRVTDKTTGKGLAGWVQHFVYRDNPHLEGSRGSGLADMRDRNVADDNGRFRIPILPGPGIVAFTAFDHEKYPRAVGALSVRGATRPDGHELIQDTHPYLLAPANFHIVSPVSPAADADRVEVNLVLDAGGNIFGKLVDAEGKPLDGARYSGKLAQYALWDQTDGDAFEVVAYDPDKPRRLLFYHAERRLAGTHVLNGPPPDELVVKLQPAGSVSGRLVDSGGEPLANMKLLHWTARMGSPAEMPQHDDAIQPAGIPLPPNLEHNRSAQHETDNEGRFTIDGLVPGVEYRMQAHNFEARTVEQALMQRISGVLEKLVVVEPGQTLELGDVRLVEESQPKPGAQNDKAKSIDRPKSRSAASQPTAQTKLTDDGSVEATGRVLRPDGEPAAGAQVYFAPRYETTAEDLAVRATTGADGRFQFAFPQSDLKRLVEGLRSPWNSPYIVARLDGFGPVATHIVTPDDAEDITLRLVPDDVPIEGQVVDLEGQPVADALLRVLRIESNPGGTLDEWLTALRKFGEYWNNSGVWPSETIQQNVAGLPATVRTDASGRFALRGMGRERVVHLRLEGPGLESTDIAAMSRPDGGLTVPLEKEHLALGTFTVYNAKFTHTAAPSQSMQGVVRDVESGEPISGVTLYCEKQAGREIHGRYPPETTTDHEGRYVLNGLRKGPDNEIAIAPPPGVPYAPQMVVMDTSQGLDAQTIDIHLKPAAVVRGRVTDEATGKPVAGAHVEYFVAIANSHIADYPGLRDAADITTTTDDDGHYKIVGLPGRGFIAVRASTDEFAAGQKIDVTSDDYEEHAGIRDDLFRTHPRTCIAKEFHAVAAAEGGENQREIERNIELRRGITRRARVLDAGGKPLAGVSVNRKGIYACEWYGGDVELNDAEFTIYGLDAEKPRSVFLKHEGRKLVGAFIVRGDSDEPIEMRLEPAGSMVGRLVDDDGKPVGHTTLYGKLADGQGDLNGYFFRSTTDEAGRFELAGLIPRLKYRLNYQESANRYVSLSSQSLQSHELSVESGNALNLGDVQKSPVTSRN